MLLLLFRKDAYPGESWISQSDKGEHVMLHKMLRDAWKEVLNTIGEVIPPAKREYYKMSAQDSFERAVKWKGDGDICSAMSLVQARYALSLAGEDDSIDKPYVEILHLKGGKKEFDSFLKSVDNPLNPLG
ncbi:MAG TPA: hypothetical protein VIF12_05020 [Micavibrio sp.]|jgi:hypothetical protein